MAPQHPRPPGGHIVSSSINQQHTERREDRFAVLVGRRPWPDEKKLAVYIRREGSNFPNKSDISDRIWIEKQPQVGLMITYEEGHETPKGYEAIEGSVAPRDRAEFLNYCEHFPLNAAITDEQAAFTDWVARLRDDETARQYLGLPTEKSVED
ncbi:hypothetical protein N0V90_012994 [Kalmusia sp. IMI 367209]|nr:hypothetical protein N0V90_012994 [Kalmusia sp. IMI 367209]